MAYASILPAFRQFRSQMLCDRSLPTGNALQKQEDKLARILLVLSSPKEPERPQLLTFYLVSVGVNSGEVLTMAQSASSTRRTVVLTAIAGVFAMVVATSASAAPLAPSSRFASVLDRNLQTVRLVCDNYGIISSWRISAPTRFIWWRSECPGRR